MVLLYNQNQLLNNYSIVSPSGGTLLIYGGSTFTGIILQDPKLKTQSGLGIRNRNQKPHTMTHGRDRLNGFGRKFNLTIEQLYCQIL